MIKKIIEHNRRFVAEGQAAKYQTSKIPRMATAIVTCMDTRLERFLPDALGIDCGDVKMIRNAGGLVTDPWDSSMRSILVAVYELGVKHVMIIAHTDCGVQGMDGDHFVQIMESRGIDPATIDTLERAGIDLRLWLSGFDDTAEAVRQSVRLVAEHPLLPRDVSVSGYIFDTATGQLTAVV